MSIDTDIENYNYKELLNIFKLDNNYAEDNLQKISNYIQMIKSNFSTDIYNFFIKASKIIECIYLLIKNKNIEITDLDKIDNYVNKIKKIKSFEKLDKIKIIDNLKSELVQNVQTNLINSNLNDYLINNNYKNETNYNVDLNNSYQKLNNKNNTNVIVNTLPNTIAPGDLNSIKRITLFQNLNLNSCFRNNYYTSSSTDFQYIIPSEIKNVVSMRLASIEIPNAWYLFSHKQKNNVFKIIINADKNTTNYTIVIPDGNYDDESLQFFLNSTYFCESNLESCLKYLRFSIDSKNFKSRFEILEDHPNICKFTFSLIFFEDINENLQNTAGWILGFRLPTYLSICDNIQSEGLFDGSGDKYIYFSLNDYQYNNNSTNIIGFDKSIMEENILAKIPMVNGKLSIIIDDNNNPLTKTRKYNGPVNIRKISIKIFDKFGNIIDLNNMDFSFTLEVELLYESFNFKDIFA
jgi:hypothetical protein